MRAHPLVRQAMEIFDASSIRVRPKSHAPSDAGLHESGTDDAEPTALIEAPTAPEAER